jgi:hypothetical protein
VSGTEATGPAERRSAKEAGEIRVVGKPRHDGNNKGSPRLKQPRLRGSRNPAALRVGWFDDDGGCRVAIFGALVRRFACRLRQPERLPEGASDLALFLAHRVDLDPLRSQELDDGANLVIPD